MKKIVSLILMFVMMLSLAGCGEGKSDEPDIKDMVYGYEILPCMNEIKGEVNAYKITDDSIYIYTTEWMDAKDMGEQQTAQYFYKCDKEGENLVNIPYVPETSNEEWLYSMDVNEEGELILLYSFYSKDSDQNGFLLRVITEDGTQVREIDIAEATGEEDLFIQNMKLDKDGNIYLLSDLNIYILNGEGEFAGSLQEESVIVCLIRTAEGEILAGFDYASGLTFKKVDAKEYVFGESYQTEISYYSISAFADGAEYDFYYSDGDGLYGYVLEDRTSAKVADWIGSNINTNYLGLLHIASRENIFAIYGRSETEEVNAQEEPYGLYVLHKKDPKDVKIKERITYVSLYPDEEVKTRAIRFNRQQNQYQVVVKDYSQSENPQQAMHKDLIAGGVADIVDLSGISSDKYMAKEIFADLYGFMDRDEEIAKEDFVENALKVMETDGKLYRITPTFGLNGVVMHKEDLQPGQALTLSRVKKLEQNGAQMWYMETNASVLSRAVEINYEEYVDWKNGECRFDSEDFKAVLEYAQSYPAEEEIVWDENTESMTAMIRGGSILSASVYNISMAELQAYEEIFEGEIGMAGFPSEIYVGSALSMDREFAICADSEHKEGAWEFLKTYLEREYISSQLISDEYVGTPIRKDSMEDKIKRFTVTETSVDDFGNVIVPISYEWGFDELTLQIKPMTDEQIGIYREMVASADHRYVYDSDVITVVQEEAEDYFEGRISSEEACANIQDRVSVYMEDYR